MTSGWAQLLIVMRIAAGNLRARKAKTVTVGGLLFCSALFITVGGAIQQSVISAIEHSIIASGVGDLQIYSAAAKAPLDLFGGFQDTYITEPIADFSRVASVVDDVPGVTAVVPMGMGAGQLVSGNVFDAALERLRHAVAAAGDGAALAVDRKVAAEVARVRQMASAFREDAQHASATLAPDDAALLQRVIGDALWEDFAREPLAVLELLENRLAPLAGEAEPVSLRYVGTDAALFARSFERFRIVRGTNIPAGERGIVLQRSVYEDTFKLKAARMLDALARGVSEGLTIASDDKLAALARALPRQKRQLLLLLDGAGRSRALAALRVELAEPTGDLGALLERALSVDDKNLSRRRALFYRVIAPLVPLYRVRIGDDLTLATLGKAGKRAANLRLYGTYELVGIDTSVLAAPFSLVDLASARELEGTPSARDRQEYAELRARNGARDVTREQAEQLLLGGGAGDGEAPLQDVQPVEDAHPTRGEEEAVHHAAVVLAPGTNGPAALSAVRGALGAHGLSARAVPWHEAAGPLTQLVRVSTAVLLLIAGVVLLTMFVVIGNAFVIATLERVAEFGTLRAIGAQRGFVFAMIVSEALAVGLLAGCAGALAGSALVAWLGAHGISAHDDSLLTFFFSGPTLRPSLSHAALATAVGSSAMVSVLANLYPLWIVSKVSPRQAMSAEE